MAQQQVDISAMSLEQLNTYKGQFENEIKQLPVWKSTSASGAPSWLGRATRNRHRHAIEQVSRRWHAL